MTTSITIRSVPTETHDELVERARRAGQSLQEYLLTTLLSITEKPDVASLLARIRARKDALGIHVPTEVILESRDLDRE